MAFIASVFSQLCNTANTVIITTTTITEPLLYVETDKDGEWLLRTSCMAAVLLPVMRRHMMMCSNNTTWNAVNRGWLSSTTNRHTHTVNDQLNNHVDNNYLLVQCVQVSLHVNKAIFIVLLLLQPFYGPFSGTTQVSWYQKKHSPTLYLEHHPTFISFFHLLWSIASSLFNLSAWQSFCTTSFHVLFCLPLGLEPSTSYSTVHIFLYPTSVLCLQHTSILS